MRRVKRERRDKDRGRTEDKEAHVLEAFNKPNLNRITQVEEEGFLLNTY